MRALGPLLVLLTGVVTLRLALTGAYTSYVRVGMLWALVASGALLTYLGLAGLWRLRAQPQDQGDHGHAGDHGHERAPRVALLLLLPLVVAYVVAPPSLGAYSARLSGGAALAGERTGYAPLPTGEDGVADADLSDTVRRALYDDAATLDGTRVRVVGFVVPTAEPPGGAAAAGRPRVLLTRFVIRCCAADGTPAQVDVALPPGAAAPAADQWLEVVMTYAGDGPREAAPRSTAESARPVPPPADPYET